MKKIIIIITLLNSFLVVSQSLKPQTYYGGVLERFPTDRVTQELLWDSPLKTVNKLKKVTINESQDVDIFIVSKDGSEIVLNLKYKGLDSSGHQFYALRNMIFYLIKKEENNILFCLESDNKIIAAMFLRDLN